MKKFLTFLSAVILVLVMAGSSSAILIGYVNNPTTNSTDWISGVTSLGGTVNSEINFDTHSTGSLISNFYSGVTLLATGDSNTVEYGTGPGQGNISFTPKSTGEGLHAVSNYLLDGDSASFLTISFDTAVLGLSLAAIDYFNPSANNPLTIEAFDFDTGNSLGAFSSVSYNFQKNYMYYMGLMSTEGNIGSVIFKDVNNSTGDITGIDNIMYATKGTPPVPEPSTILLMVIGMLGMVGIKARKKG